RTFPPPLFELVREAPASRRPTPRGWWNRRSALSISGLSGSDKPRSVDADMAVAGHLLPFPVVGAHVRVELRLAHIHDVDPHLPVALAHRLRRQGLAQRAVQLVGDRDR